MRAAIVNLLNGLYGIRLRAGTAPASNDLDWLLPGSAPTVNQTLQVTGVTSTAVTIGWGNVGTVSSVALTTPSFLSVAGSPVTGSGTLAVSLASQTANTTFAGPSSGAAAAPTFRALVPLDIPALPASQITTGVFAYSLFPIGQAASTVAAGNDSRFHTQNTDTGTTSQSFQLQSGSTGALLQNNVGTIEVRNAANTAYANLTCATLNVTVGINETTVNQVNVVDSTFNLNSSFVGTTGMTNAGVQVNRGTATNGAASLLWNESRGRWSVGYLGSESDIARFVNQTFTSASLSGSQLTVTHNLGRQYIHYSIFDPSNRDYFAEIVSSTANAFVLEFGQASNVVTGTWNIAIVG